MPSKKRPSTSTDSPSSKRRRTQLTISDKKFICQYKKDNPTSSLADCIQYVSSRLNKHIGRTTIHDIVKKSHFLSASVHLDNEVRIFNQFLVGAC